MRPTGKSSLERDLPSAAWGLSGRIPGANAMQLTIAFDAFLPVARWGPLFHVLCLEQPRLTLEWQPVGFPSPGRSPLDHADVGLLVEPLVGPGLDSLTIDSSPMVAVMPVGHPLARHDEISVADILDERFLDVQALDPPWRAIWTLDERRGAPAKLIEPPVADAGAALAATASGAAIGTVPEWAANGLHHPGVVSVALRDGPSMATRLVWHANDDNAIVRALIELAAAWATLSRDRWDAPSGRSSARPER
jgi:DNA-binding transcriptional LysR family regulator